MSEEQLSDDRSFSASCDVCGKAVTPDDYVSAELTAQGATCPTAMTFHQLCYQAAAEMWQPDPESTCIVDPLFPEMAAWAPQREESQA